MMDEPFLPTNDDGVPPYLEKDPGAPWWLRASYVLVPIWGLIILALYWNGSWGWLDRGYWHELQEAANTTFPYHELKIDP